MKIMSVYKAVMLENSDISTIVDTRIFVDLVDQNAVKPNILIEMPDQGQEYTHSGPSAVQDAHIKITCRGDTAGDVAALGKLVTDHLKSFIGTRSDLQVMLTEKFKVMSAFDKKAGVFTHVSEYTSFFKEVSP